MSTVALPLVSVIMPAFNSVEYISAAIDSVLAQTLVEWELIVVDDASVDGTDEIVAAYARRDSRIKFYRLERNAGAAFCRNLAIENSLGRFIAFLDSDDLWVTDKLQRQIQLMLKNSWAFTYGSYRKIDEVGRDLGLVPALASVSYSKMLLGNFVGCLTAVYDTEVIGKVFMPAIRKRQDYGLWLSILKRVDRAYGIVEPLGFYRVRADSVSSNKIAAVAYTWRIYREVEGLSWARSVFCFASYLFFTTLKNKFPALYRGGVRL